MKVIIDPHRCPQNHPCPSIRACPVGALSQKGFNAPQVDDEKCLACMKCVHYCPLGAIQSNHTGK